MWGLNRARYVEQVATRNAKIEHDQQTFNAEFPQKMQEYANYVEQLVENMKTLPVSDQPAIADKIARINDQLGLVVAKQVDSGNSNPQVVEVAKRMEANQAAVHVRAEILKAPHAQDPIANQNLLDDLKNAIVNATAPAQPSIVLQPVVVHLPTNVKTATLLTPAVNAPAAVHAPAAVNAPAAVHAPAAVNPPAAVNAPAAAATPDDGSNAPPPPLAPPDDGSNAPPPPLTPLGTPPVAPPPPLTPPDDGSNAPPPPLTPLGTPPVTPPPRTPIVTHNNPKPTSSSSIVKPPDRGGLLGDIQKKGLFKPDEIKESDIGEYCKTTYKALFYQKKCKFAECTSEDQSKCKGLSEADNELHKVLTRTHEKYDSSDIQKYDAAIAKCKSDWPSCEREMSDYLKPMFAKFPPSIELNFASDDIAMLKAKPDSDGAAIALYNRLDKRQRQKKPTTFAEIGTFVNLLFADIQEMKNAPNKIKELDEVQKVWENEIRYYKQKIKTVCETKGCEDVSLFQTCDGECATLIPSTRTKTRGAVAATGPRSGGVQGTLTQAMVERREALEGKTADTRTEAQKKRDEEEEAEFD